jgi:hypothetical protein
MSSHFSRLRVSTFLVLSVPTLKLFDNEQAPSQLCKLDAELSAALWR